MTFLMVVLGTVGTCIIMAVVERLLEWALKGRGARQSSRRR